MVGVSLRSAAVAQALAPQDHLYTLVTLDAEIGFRVIGAHTAFLSARTAPREALATLTRSGTTLVTLTITEKGYGLGADGRLDLEHADIRHDLADPRNPTSAIGWLVEALRLRRAAGAAAFDVLSCDNLPANGVKLRAAVLDLAAAHDRDLASWIAAEARFPCSMVDAITPATDGALRARVAREVGLADAWPVQREAFAAWVIEDAGASWLADLASVGAVVTTDVAGHERAKLRLLNGAHTCLAYLGLARGHATVKEAMADAELARFVAALMREEIAPSLDAPPGLDLGRYGDGIRARFANPAIRHALAQIAWDGSQKLPIRLMGTIRDNLAAGRPIDRLATGVAAWMRFVRRRARAGVEIVDPEASRLRAIGEACSDEARRDTALFLERSGVIAPGAVAAAARGARAEL